MRQASFSIDTLVYDFNFNLGDTLPPLYINQAESNNWVSKIDSILIGGVFHKQYWISDDTSLGGHLNYVALIEGVGATNGLFAGLKTGGESSSSLNCFEVNGTTMYPNNGPICSPIVLSLGEEDAIFQIIIYPNPNDGNMMLDYSLNTLDKGEIMIYDIAEKLMYKYELDASASQIIISHQKGFNNGIYFYRIKVNDKIVQSDKLIIIK